MFKILSIDGGGIRGIIPARILTEIEALTGKRIAEMFDLICGTSTGGIIALSLACPGAHGTPKYTAGELVDLYEKHGAKIFPSGYWTRVDDVQNYYQPRYSPQGLADVLCEYLQDVPLRDALTDVLIPAYEIERRVPFFFKSRKARGRMSHGFRMRDVALATAAAPTYFPPHKIEIPDTDETFVLVDGGIFANNPTLCGYVEAKKNYKEADEIFILSIGTGARTTSLWYEEAKDWGKIGWAQPVIDIALDAVSSTVDYQMNELNRHDSKLRYHRFQVRLDAENEKLDDTSERQLRVYSLIAESVLREQQDLLTEIYPILNPDLASADQMNLPL